MPSRTAALGSRVARTASALDWVHIRSCCRAGPNIKYEMRHKGLMGKGSRAAALKVWALISTYPCPVLSKVMLPALRCQEDKLYAASRLLMSSLA